MEEKNFNFKDEIERRFANSFINKIYIFPRILTSSHSSSVSSIYSSLNESTYQLHQQNSKTPPKKRRMITENIPVNNWISAERKLTKNLSSCKAPVKNSKGKRTQIRSLKTNSVFLNSDSESKNLTNSIEKNIKKSKGKGLHKTCQTFNEPR